MIEINEMFQQAFANYKYKNIQKAAEGYQQVLSVEPNHPSVLHLLGVIEFD